jgi:hypothetical protein
MVPAIVKRVLIGFVALLAVMYLADTASARFHAYGAVQVQPYYAIHLKNKKVEFDFSPPMETQYCVVSTLPHFGLDPCWYVQGHTQRRIDE